MGSLDFCLCLAVKRCSSLAYPEVTEKTEREAKLTVSPRGNQDFHWPSSGSVALDNTSLTLSGILTRGIVVCFTVLVIWSFLWDYLAFIFVVVCWIVLLSRGNEVSFLQVRPCFDSLFQNLRTARYWDNEPFLLSLLFLIKCKIQLLPEIFAFKSLLS